MTKADIVEAVYQRVGLSKKESAEIVDDVFEVVREQLEEGNPMKLSGFGNFNVRRKNERRGRNPKTGEETMITARTVVTFKPSLILRNRVSG